eukprot:m.150825 g.150825  ORF g.150825 m.150825 type:complete len:50 (+) comp17832_c0_seq2:813-962(+)
MRTAEVDVLLRTNAPHCLRMKESYFILNLIEKCLYIRIRSSGCIFAFEL